MDPRAIVSRRRLLQSGAGLLCAAGGGAALTWQAQARAMGKGQEQATEQGSAHADHPPFSQQVLDPQETLRAFEHGRLIEENGRRVRLFEVEARSITLALAAEVRFKAWSLSRRVPGPTLRARQGERIRVVFHNGDSTSHSLHFHGTHTAAMTGTTGAFGLTAEARAQHRDHAAQSTPLAGHAEGGEGGEGGEDGGAAHGQAASSDTEVLVVLAQMQGHLLVAQELLSRGDAPAAEPHVGHPVDELYGSLEAVIVSGRLQPFRESLELLRQQVRLAPTAAITTRKLADAQQMLQSATNAVAPTLNSQPALMLAVVRQLALTAASEYDAAVADDRVAEMIEYQDARGFLLQARRLLSQVLAAAPSAATSLQPAQARLEAMLKAFPTTLPPQRIVLSVSQLNSLAAAI